MIGEMIGATPHEAKHRISTTGFIRYVEYLKQKENKKHPLEKQIAMLTHQMYLTMCAVKMIAPKIKDYQSWLFEAATAPKADKVQKELTEDEKKSKLNRSKSTWKFIASSGGSKKTHAVGKDRRKKSLPVKPVKKEGRHESGRSGRKAQS